MSTSTSINGTSYTSFDGAFSGTVVEPADGTYTAVAPFGIPPREGSPEYEELLVTYAGVSGVGTKQLGFRGRDITIDLISTATSRSTIETARNGILSGMTPTSRFSVTIPSGTARLGTKLKRGGCTVKSWFTIGTKTCCLYTLELRQMSETN